MPDDWDPFHHFAVGAAGPYFVVVASAAGSAVVVGGVVEVAVAAVEGQDYSPLNKESQSSRHDEKFELHDEKVPKTWLDFPTKNCRAISRSTQGLPIFTI